MQIEREGRRKGGVVKVKARLARVVKGLIRGFRINGVGLTKTGMTPNHSNGPSERIYVLYSPG